MDWPVHCYHVSFVTSIRQKFCVTGKTDAVSKSTCRNDETRIRRFMRLSNQDLVLNPDLSSTNFSNELRQTNLSYVR